MDDTAPTPASSTATMTSTPIVGQLLETSATTVKPGWQTTEFYFALAAKILSGLFAFGLVGDGSTLSRLAGVAGFVLTQMGYTVSRTLIKTAAMVAVVMFAFHSTGCGASTRLKTLNATTASVTAADLVFNAFEKQHEIDLANSPAAATKADAQALVAAFIVNRDKARKAITAALNALSAAWKLDDDTSVANAVKAATAVTAALAALGVQL